MRIVQTFWSQNKNVQDNAFGWLSPEHHVMGWAYSCLKLKEHYDDVQIYTDINGASLLIDQLGLPYTAVHRCYDDINHLNENLWALPKILTYKAQHEPFIHVDGDVFIWKKFDEQVEKAALIAQNPEIGTAYGKVLMRDVESSVKNIPDFLRTELKKETISSFNAGVLGGSDIVFIQDYCREALALVYNNEPTKRINHLSQNFNILFEQILFSVLCSINEKKVTSVLPRTFNDNGYTTAEIADISAAPYKLSYLHLIGSKKRDHEICDVLSRSLLRDYPEMFFRIKALFKNRHRLYHSKIRHLAESNACTEMMEPTADDYNGYSAMYRTSRELGLIGFSDVKPDAFKLLLKDEENPEIEAVFGFESAIKEQMLRWQDISGEDLFQCECRAHSYFPFFYERKEHQLSTVFERNQHLEIIEQSFDWTEDIKRRINDKLLSYAVGYATGIAITPQLFENGINEVVIDELDFNILLLLSTPRALNEILSLLIDCFPDTNAGHINEQVFELVMVKIKHLLTNKCIFIRT